MSRSVSWRRLRTDAVSNRIEEALQATMYLVNQTGPTGFVLKQEGCEKKMKVMLGDPHTCTCAVYRKEKDLCIHVLWLLLKKFRVPKENPIVHQLGLVEREINKVLQGHVTKQTPAQDSSLEEGCGIPRTGSCDQRPVSRDDACPICLDGMLAKPQKLMYCRYGCGKTVHLKCLKVWADHQRSQGEETVYCPLCRGTFCTFLELSKELHSCAQARMKTGRESIHTGISCSHCRVCPIAGKCFKCTSCINLYLCHSCFKTNSHSQHNFEFRQHPNHHWRPAVRPLTSLSLPPLVVNELQQQETTDNDHNTLPQSDRPPLGSLVVGPRKAPQQLLNSLPAEPLDHSNPLLLAGVKCQVCSMLFSRGDWICKLSCRHKFHRGCLYQWFSTEGPTCPVDGKMLDTLRPSGGGGSRKAGGYRRGSLTSAALHHSNVPSEQRPPLNMFISGHTWAGLSCGSVECKDSHHQTRIATGCSPQRAATPFVHGGFRRRNSKPQPIEMEFSLQATSLPPVGSNISSGQSVEPITRPVESSGQNSNMSRWRSRLLHSGVRQAMGRRRHSLPVSALPKNVQQSDEQRRGLVRSGERLPPAVSTDTKVQPVLHISRMSLSEHTLPAIDAHRKTDQF